MSKLRTGARTPFFATDITNYHHLTTGNFSPIDNAPAAYSDSEEDMFIHNGFLVKNATDTAGLVYCVTWEVWQRARQRANHALVSNITVLAAINPVAIYLAAGQWAEVPVVKVFATTSQTFPSTVTYINVGTIR